VKTQPSTKEISLKSERQPDSRARRPGADAGVSLLEIIIVAAMLGIILGAAISRMNAGMYNADNAAKELAGNLRRSRSQAVGNGYHYRVNIGATSYAVNRMVLGAGNAWGVDGGTPTRTVTLPAKVTVSQGTGTYEFDSRGSTVGANAMSTVRVHDSARNLDVDVRIWPSGQVF
jgi:Tfp pilus assembly protein FimT